MRTDRSMRWFFLGIFDFLCLVCLDIFDILKKTGRTLRGNRHIFEPGTYDVTSPNACTSYAALPFPSKLMEYR
ncbi:hypothetical protein ACQKI4_27370, partial [Paenibacillus glucanolyticus]|uniref:hypothetical protein n=1 Tax=Paenibacillus glucanolyticus TaxID=59843 RepID=UPI003D07537E